MQEFGVEPKKWQLGCVPLQPNHFLNVGCCPAATCTHFIGVPYSAYWHVQMMFWNKGQSYILTKQTQSSLGVSVFEWNENTAWWSFTPMFSCSVYCWMYALSTWKPKENGAFDRQKCTQLWAGPSVGSINKLVSDGSFSTNHWVRWGFCFKLEFLCRYKHISHNDNKKWWVLKYCRFHWILAFNLAANLKRCKKGVIKLIAPA